MGVRWFHPTTTPCSPPSHPPTQPSIGRTDTQTERKRKDQPQANMPPKGGYLHIQDSTISKS